MIQDKKIAYISAQWFGDIVNAGKAGFHDEIIKLGVPEANIEYFSIPGSLELPFIANRLAKTGEFDAIVCAGFIVDGGIYRHEFVSSSVLDGLVRVSIDHDLPVLSVVLTPQKFDEESGQDIEFFLKHLHKKGKEAANATLGILKASDAIKER